MPIQTVVERFFAMGTRVELHCFGACDADAVFLARRAIEAVDDALSIHRPSPTTALNDRLRDGGPVAVDDPLLLDALAQIDDAYAAMEGLFDPAAGSAGWRALTFDPVTARVEAATPLALDFGGFGKGFALDRACAALRIAGVVSAMLSAGESSIAVVGEHPLGGGWPFAVPHPQQPDRTLIDLELESAALSISSTVGGGAEAPGRSEMIRPTDGAPVTAPRLAIAVEPSGALAEMMSTALLVAQDEQMRRLTESAPTRRFRFDFPSAATMPAQPVRMVS